MFTGVDVPSRNVEIKARLSDEECFQRKVDIAKKLTGSSGEIIKQHDVFFNSLKGRLKLRYLETKKSELILYFRADEGGPKLSTYHKIDLDEPKQMEVILTESVGVKGEVKKRRYLFLHEQTRIHLDEVEGLGHFLEFEVVLKSDQCVEEGTAIANEMMKIFEIEEKDLIVGAYIDKLLK
ncbi:uncharacterized protein LOC129773225 [Toxorhynchites rutilus septentrionalis]|uniref:uncharacterized protein LOC129773225 n=1 Tax=Toxorhynchites rutilus septentrionalis TaxID=329112 RepID=UPI002479FD7C|nr:uncharacterized protein LOC129773225 [Toxorhynchites rutilus septentrionalis]